MSDREQTAPRVRLKTAGNQYPAAEMSDKVSKRGPATRALELDGKFTSTHTTRLSRVVGSRH